MRFAFDHEHIAATSLGEMISDARPNDATADDDYVRGFSHNKKVSQKGAKIAKKKGEQSRSPLPDRLLSPLSVGLVLRCYAGAGVPPVIGGRIGFSGRALGSLTCGCSSLLT